MALKYPTPELSESRSETILSHNSWETIKCLQISDVTKFMHNDLVGPYTFWVLTIRFKEQSDLLLLSLGILSNWVVLYLKGVSFTLAMTY